MKDTVTYPLSAIMDEDEESPAEQLERELAEAKKALRVAVGLLLIMPQFSNIHPDDMLEAILKETRERK